MAVTEPREPERPIDTTNDFMVSVAGNGTLGIVRPPMGAISKDEALRLAAWLVVLADPLDESWPAVKNAVRNT